jgi:ketosteroid isomerase-like protein
VHSRYALLVLAVATSVTACRAEMSEDLSPADRTAIKHSIDEYARLGNAKDFTGAVRSYFTSDGVALPPNGASVVGNDAIATWLANFPPFTDLAFEEVKLEGRGDLAYLHGTFSLMFTPPGATAPIKEQGKHVTIFKRQADGGWKASLGIFNSDLPAPTAPTPPTPEANDT